MDTQDFIEYLKGVSVFPDTNLIELSRALIYIQPDNSPTAQIIEENEKVYQVTKWSGETLEEIKQSAKPGKDLKEVNQLIKTLAENLCS